MRGHVRGHGPYIPREAQFSLNICSRCVDYSLIIGLHTQADEEEGKIKIDDRYRCQPHPELHG